MKTAGFPHIRENGHYRPAREQAKQREAGAPPGRCERIFVHIRQARRVCRRTEGFGCPSLRPRWECVRGNLRHPSFPTLCRRGHGRRIPPQILPFTSPRIGKTQILPSASPRIGKTQILPSASPLLGKTQILPFASPLLPMRCVRAAYPAANSPVRLTAHRQNTNSPVRLTAPRQDDGKSEKTARSY